MSRNRIRLNAGRIVVLDLIPGALGITVDGAQLAATDEEALKTLASSRPFRASSFPTAVYVTAPAAHLDEVWARVLQAHRSVVESAIAASQVSPYRYAHSSGVVDMLREDYDADIENPQGAVAGAAPLGGRATPPDLDETIAAYDRQHGWAKPAPAEKRRQEIIAKFPRDAWPTLPLDRYALGTGAPDAYCYIMEFGSTELGSIRGGAAYKHVIFKRATGSWYFDKTYPDVKSAWTTVRAAFVQALDLAEAEDYDAIDELAPIKSGIALRCKTVYVYFPDAVLPIYSTAHLRRFITLLGGDPAHREGVAANRYLLQLLRNRPEFEGWSTIELAGFLYAWADPRQTRRVVKIAPGPDARYWPECRDNGYICVGWDDVGDLAAYGSQEEFQKAFEDAYRSEYNNNQSKLTLKGREVWMLRELEPGDVVVANRGVSRVVGVGTVVEPGYSWRPARADYRHTVAVHWDDVTERTLDPSVPTWATTTVAAVKPDLYRRIALGAAKPARPGSGGIVEPDPLFLQLDVDLRRRKQVVLYGPPGTGKTYMARRFSVWWLLQQMDDPEYPSVLGDESALRKQEVALAVDAGYGAALLTRVTFHPSYSYEDFVEGFKPAPTEGRGGLELALQDGVFKKVSQAAQRDPGRPYLMIIDEFNRANVPKIFGELITLLESDKRGLSVTLPYSGISDFQVPSNVYILATMNTADRSIRLLDAALRRRFAFVELMPDAELLGGATVGKLPLDTFLLTLNRRIVRHVGREKQIGHSFFLADGEPVTDPEDFSRRFLGEVLPLLQEYAYEDYRLLKDLIGDALVDVEAQTLKTLVLQDPGALVEALAQSFQDTSSDDGA